MKLPIAQYDPERLKTALALLPDASGQRPHGRESVSVVQQLIIAQATSSEICSTCSLVLPSLVRSRHCRLRYPNTSLPVHAQARCDALRIGCAARSGSVHRTRLKPRASFYVPKSLAATAAVPPTRSRAPSKFARPRSPTLDGRRDGIPTLRRRRAHANHCRPHQRLRCVHSTAARFARAQL